jgi:hypothetical protein
MWREQRKKIGSKERKRGGERGKSDMFPICSPCRFSRSVCLLKRDLYLIKVQTDQETRGRHGTRENQARETEGEKAGERGNGSRETAVIEREGKGGR